MKKINITYWIVTGLFAFVMFGSAIPDIMVMPMAVKGFASLGLPAYFVPFVGGAKALGVVAILVPGYPRLKEWAYAGLTFDLIGATYCLIASGQPVANWAVMPVFIGLAAAAYLLYHKRLKAKVATSATAIVQDDLSLA
ncbi:DoxX family protein [Mucilaginibacter sp.]